MTCSLLAITGRDIMKKSENLRKPESVKSLAQMSIYKGGRLFNLLDIKLTGIKKGENEKVLLEIVRPVKDRLKVLTHTSRGEDDLQWLKMKNGKIKPVKSAKKRSDSFANSHFFYEDLRSRDIDNYKYTLIPGIKNFSGHDCYVVKSVPQPGKSIYKKAVFYIIKSGEFKYFVAGADIYYKGYLYKRMTSNSIKKIKGIITPYESVMQRFDSNGKMLGRSVLRIKKIKYNSRSIKNSFFNLRKL